MTMMTSSPPPAVMLKMAGRVSRLSDRMWTSPGEMWSPPTWTCVVMMQHRTYTVYLNNIDNAHMKNRRRKCLNQNSGHGFKTLLLKNLTG